MSSNHKLSSRQIAALKPRGAAYEMAAGGVPGLYFNCQPSGHRSWSLRYRAGNKTRKLGFGTFPAIDLDQARKLGSRFYAQTIAGGDPGAERKAKRQGVKTAKREAIAAKYDVIDRVAKQYLARHAVKLRAGSAKEIARILRKEVLPQWRGRRLSEISKRDVLDLLHRIVDRGAPIMANRVLAGFRGLCSWAIEQDLISISPCAGVKAPADETSRDRVLDDSELSAVLEAAQRFDAPYGSIVRLLALTGARLREVSGMTWDEVDFVSRTWTLPAARAKNGRQHVVPLSPQALAILEKVPPRNGFVFASAVTWRAPSGFSRAKRALDLMLPSHMPGWCLHDLRRTAASGMAGLGVAPHVIEACLNHRSGVIKGVASVYNFPQDRIDAAMGRKSGRPSTFGRRMSRASKTAESLAA